MSKHEKPVETTGHSWDGIEELNNPLPRWWLYIFYASILFSLVYVVLFPAIPIPGGNTPGMLGWSSRGKVQTEMAALEASRSAVLKDIETIPLSELANNPEMMRAAIEGGRSAYKMHCEQCHGSGAAGGIGYPNLNDDDWLWGGDMEAIHYTLTHGIRHPGDDNTRMSQMPAFGRDQLLSAAEVDAVTEYVLQIAGKDANPALAVQGAPIFAQQCSSCHGDDGKGNRMFGAPNLTDAIWLYGEDRAAIHSVIFHSRNGVMPAWNTRLSEATIRKLTAYVHSLGGGE